jgi:hypothetical protein
MQLHGLGCGEGGVDAVGPAVGADHGETAGISGATSLLVPVLAVVRSAVAASCRACGVNQW